MLVKNNKEEFGMSGPFEVKSRESFADEMMPTLQQWAQEEVDRHGGDVEEITARLRREFADGLEEVWKYNGEEYNSVRDVVAAALGEYLTGDFGERLAFHADGVVCLMGQQEYYRDEIASRKCYGIGNMDMSYYREGWDNDELTDREVILSCVEDGDMTEEIDSITEHIERSLEEVLEDGEE